MKTKFNSQICTTREQSERLLSLGLKKETADMVYEKSVTYPYEYELRIFEDGDYLCNGIISDSIPAWSLHRLWELYWSNKVVSDCLFRCGRQMSPYAKMIAMIEYDIEDGTFNKEYLENEYIKE